MTDQELKQKMLGEETYSRVQSANAVDFKQSLMPDIATKDSSAARDFLYGVSGISSISDVPGITALNAKQYAMFLGGMAIKAAEIKTAPARAVLRGVGIEQAEEVLLASKAAQMRLALNIREHKQALYNKAVGEGIDPTSTASLLGSGTKSLLDYVVGAAGGFLLAGPPGAAAGITAVRSAQSAGIATEKYSQYLGAGVDENKALFLASSMGMANYAIEGIAGLGATLRVGKEGIKQVAKESARVGIQKYMATQALKGGAGEFVEEAVEDVIEQGMDNYVGIRQGWSLGEVFVSGSMGMLFGGIAGAGHAGIEFNVARNELKTVLSNDPRTAELAQDKAFVDTITEHVMTGSANMFMDEIIQTQDVNVEELTTARRMIDRANGIPTQADTVDKALRGVIEKSQNFDMYLQSLAQEAKPEKRIEVKAALRENATQIRSLVQAINAIETSDRKNEATATKTINKLESQIKELSMAKELENFDLSALKTQLYTDIQAGPKGLFGKEATRDVKKMSKAEDRIVELDAQINGAIDEMMNLKVSDPELMQGALEDITTRITSLDELKSYVLATGDVTGNVTIAATKLRQERLQYMRQTAKAAEKSGKLSIELVQSMVTAFRQTIDKAPLPADFKNALRRKYQSKLPTDPAKFYERYNGLKADIEKVFIYLKRRQVLEGLDHILISGRDTPGLSQEIRDEYSRLLKIKKDPLYEAAESDVLGHQVAAVYHDADMHPDLAVPLLEDLVSILSTDRAINAKKQEIRKQKIDKSIDESLKELGTQRVTGPEMAFEKDKEPKRMATAFMSNFKRHLNLIGPKTYKQFDPLKRYLAKMEGERKVVDKINNRLKSIFNAKTEADMQEAMINRTDREQGYDLEVGVEDAPKKMIKISREQAVSLVMLARMPKIGKDIKKHLLSEAELNRIVEVVEGDVQDKAIIDTYREVLDSYIPRIREIYNRVYPGRRFSPVENYFMVSRMFLDGNDFASDTDIQMLEGLFEGGGFGGSEEAMNSNLKERKGANAIRIGDALSQMQRYTRNMEHFLAFADYLNVYKQWLAGVEKGVATQLSKSSVDALHGYAQVIARGDYGIRPLHTSVNMNKFMRNFMTAVLAKPKQFVQQYSAVLAAKVPIKDIGIITGEAVQGYATKSMPNDIKLILDSAYMKQRLGSDRFELFLEPAVMEGTDALKDFKSRSLRYKLRTFSRGGDALASLVVGTHAFRQAKGKGKSDGDALLSAIEAIDTTQQSILPTSNPLSAIGGGVPVRLAYMFKATTTQLANNQLMEIDNAKRAFKGSGNKKRLAKDIAGIVWKYHVVLPSAFYLASYGMAGSVKDWVRNMILGYFGSTYLVGDGANVMYDIITAGAEKVTGEDLADQKWIFATQDVMGQVLDDLRQKSFKLINADPEMDVEYLEDVASVIGPVMDVLTGLPVSAGTDAMTNLSKAYQEEMSMGAYLEALYGLSWSSINKREEG